MQRSVHVVNPYARELTFVDARTRTRRDHEKYLTLIDTVAFLHQHQRERKTIARDGRTLTYIEVTPADIAVANRLAAVVLGRSLDELSPQARKLLGLLTEMVQVIAARERLDARAVRFTRRTVRHFTGWSDFQVRAHLGQLQSLEYVLAHHGTRGQLYVYELLYLDAESPAERDQTTAGVLNLREYDVHCEGGAGNCEQRDRENEGTSSPERGPIEPPVRSPAIASIACAEKALGSAAAVTAQHSTNGTHPGRHRTIPAGEP